MDPGNWATDIQGGALYNYQLLSVVLISSLLAIFLQALSAKLGIATGRDLAQACRDAYPKPVSVALWISAEIGIVACDIAEVIGAAIALDLLFHIPMVWGVILTALDVLLILGLQSRGFRKLEAIVIGLIAIVTAIFVIELFFAHPEWNAALGGIMPTKDIITNGDKLYLSLGILGATVMPHNLYLHSAIIQTRAFGDSDEEKAHALKAAQTDSAFALVIALAVNAAILILSAAAFYRTGHGSEAGDIRSAYALLTPLLGTALATPLFAVALLAAGQNSTITGTLAGQVVLEGFTDWRIPNWARRLISRSLAIIPAVIAVAMFGSKGSEKLLIFSQVVLSLQLSLAVFPLVQFTSDRAKMGRFVNGPIIKASAWISAVAILGLNGYLVFAVLILGKS